MRHALVVRGGWEGHQPHECAALFAGELLLGLDFILFGGLFFGFFLFLVVGLVLLGWCVLSFVLAGCEMEDRELYIDLLPTFPLLLLHR